MEQDTGSGDRIDFSVGDEMRLDDILRGPDVIPLLKAALKAGARAASILDAKGGYLWTEGDFSFLPGAVRPRIEDAPAGRNTKGPQFFDNGGAPFSISPLYHEGEPIGFLLVELSAPDDKGFLSSLTEVALASLESMIKNNVKRMLTTEMHTKIVNQSYEELLETNRRLTASEREYRELALTLERKVGERTAELKAALARLLQQEKMASIGQLAAGVAHEINNPIGFISSNLNTLRKYAGNMKEMLEFYRKAAGGPAFNGPLREEAEELYGKLKIAFIVDDIDEMTRQSLEGSERIRDIVANLKGFSHIDESVSRELDVNEELDKIIIVLSHEIKERGAEIERDYGRVRGFFCNPGLVCQAFLNILLNALESKEMGPKITVKTGRQEDAVTVSIADNGRGIPQDIQGRIFDPFFTTKDVGKGMGMGLTVAYDVITAYGGGIEVRSEAGKGSTFIIKLPVKRDG